MPPSTEENTAAEMVTCDQCGKMVAEMSLAVHRARACRGVARSSTIEDDNANENNTESDDDVIDLCDSPDSRKRHDDAPSSPPPRRRQRRGMPKRDDADAMDVDSDNGNDDEVEVLEPERNNNTNSNTSNSNSSAEVVDLFNEDNDEWACPRCTLLNDNSKSNCEACGCRHAASSNNNDSGDGVRPADPVRRERLIDDGYGFGNSVNSPLSTIGGGAILGGIMGATGAYMRGRPISSGIFEGGVTGAVGGALLNEFNRTPERNRQARQHYASPEAEDLSQARSAGANGLPAYPVMARGSSRHSTRQPRASFRVASVESPEGYRTTIVTTSGGGDGRTRIIRRSHNAGRDSFRSLMLHSMMGDMGGMGRPGMSGGNIDNMSYEQLLATFGDGSENLGASALDISALPVAKVTTKPDGTIDLPAEARECSICLENFEAGQQRKTLPCLHGFHCECVDKWLNSNGACPVCKFRVDQRGSS